MFRTAALGRAGLPTPTVRRVVAAVVVLALSWVAFSVYGERARGDALDASVAKKRAENADLSKQVADRRNEVAAATTTGWLQEEARKLGFVMPGERVFILTPGGRPLPPSGGVDFKQPPAFAGATPSPAARGSTPGATGSPAASTAPAQTPQPTPQVFVLPPPPGG
jgi:cell division protein FtsB